MEIQTNPLAKNFRQPVIHIKLPSGGQFWPAESINMPVTGELPIYSMTAKDELTLKTPDALLNGSGIVATIQSCCPCITNAWDCPSIDVDTLVISMRIASYGKMMNVEADCPKCKEENEFEIDLQAVVNGIKIPNYSDPIQIGDLKVFLKPQRYFDVNKKSSMEFEEKQILRSIQQISDDDVNKVELQNQFNVHLNKLIELNIESLVSNTSYILMENGTKVSNAMHLREFYQNSAAPITKSIQLKLKEIAEEMAVKPFDVQCCNEECKHEFKVAFTFDYSSFFV